MPRKPLHPHVQVQEPIDYEALAEAYVLARWRWTDCHGVPSAEQIKTTVELLKKHGGNVETGGLKLQDGALFIAPKLAMHLRRGTVGVDAVSIAPKGNQE